MATLNRNIITTADIEKLRTARRPEELPKTLDVQPPAGVVAPAQIVAGNADEAGNPPPANPPAAPGNVPVPSADDYLTKLLKYVPLEVLGAYLFIAGVVQSNVSGKHDIAVWLFCLLIGFLLITVIYDLRVLKIVRVTQIVMSMVGLAVYIFSIGGWFATTTWYHQWYATIVLPLFGLLVAIIGLKPLPDAGTA